MKKILIIAPHPDDEMIGVGGTIIKNIGLGNEVHVVVVTKGKEPLFDEKLISQTREEAMLCHKSLGIKQTYFLDFPSTMLDVTPKYKLNGAILDIVRQIEPDEVYIPHDGDMHFDHGIVSEAALVAVRPKYSFAPDKVYAYETLSETGWNLPEKNAGFIPNVFVDISECLKDKLEALAMYKTQLEDFPAARSVKAIEALALYRGALSNTRAAEAFMLIREVRR